MLRRKQTGLFANGAIPEDEGTLLGMKVIVPLVGYAYSNGVSAAIAMLL